MDLKIRNILIPLLCAFALCSCGGSGDVKEETKTVFAMDTVMDLKAYGDNAEKALDAAEKEINRLDRELSRGETGSEIYLLNAVKSAELSEETAGLIKTALEICGSTDGAFDITIAPVMDLWGFFTKKFRVPEDGELQDALVRVDYGNVNVENNNVTLGDDTEIDLGGIAKGYLSGRIAEIFRKNGVKSGIVSLGGNVQAIGAKTDGSPWKVAVQHPDGGFIGVVSVTDKAVITSGGYQRFFESDGRIYHHIIDPKTGSSADSGLRSVTIVSDDPTRADGLSTSLFVMGLDSGADYWRNHDGFDVIFLTDDNDIYITEGIEDIFSSDYDYEIVKR